MTRPHTQAGRSFRIKLLLPGLILLAASGAGAQQSCLPATTAAEQSVSRYLQASPDVPWLRSHGITATQVGELQPLVDATDAALCRHIDSTMTALPAYYYRAGAYVIATNARGWRDPNTGGFRRSRGGEFGRNVFLFDSTGHLINAQRERIVAPPDLHPTSAVAGAVVLVWTNRSATMSNYQLQRAIGGGTFTNIGPPLAANATTATDATATNGNSYQYRLAAIGAIGTSYSNTVSVTLGDIGPVTRTATGLLFRDDFNRPDGAVGSDWVAESGTWQIVNNALQTSVAQSQTAVLRLGALANRQDYHVQLRSSRSQLINYAPMMVRRAYNMMYQLDLGSTNEAGGVPRLYRLNGWWNLLKYGTFKSVADSSYRITFSAIGSSLRVWINGGREITAEAGLGGNLVPGNFALQAYAGSVPGTMRFDDVVICSGRTITVIGVPVGYRVRVVGSVSPPAGSGGTVTLDLFGTQLPAAQVEILDNTDAVVKVFAPTDGVWGGDRYSLNGAP